MSLGSTRYQLASAFKTLRLHWEDTEDDWRDVVRRDFDEQYWRTMADRMPPLLTAIDRLDQILIQVRQDCGDTP